MQAPTHILAGAVFAKYFPGKPGWKRGVLIAITCFFLHSSFDRLARLTYHVPNALWNDPFWLGYHFLVLVGFVSLMIWLIRKYPVGILFSLLPDLDWVFIHGGHFLGFSVPGWEKPRLHEFIHSIMDFLPPFSFLSKLPDLTGSRWGVIPELILVSSLIFLLMRRKESRTRD